MVTIASKSPTFPLHGEWSVYSFRALLNNKLSCKPTFCPESKMMANTPGIRMHILSLLKTGLVWETLRTRSLPVMVRVSYKLPWDCAGIGKQMDTFHLCLDRCQPLSSIPLRMTCHSRPGSSAQCSTLHHSSGQIIMIDGAA